jgi:hypothetical protein
MFRVPISITKEMDQWLQDLSRKMKSTGGYKLPKSYILRALLNATMHLKVDVNAVKTEKELAERILSAIKKYK